jgi:hypothetical protein
MEELRLITLFRWGRNLVLVAFLAGMLFARDATTGVVLGLIDERGAQITAQMKRALLPVLSEPEETTSQERSGGTRDKSAPPRD